MAGGAPPAELGSKSVGARLASIQPYEVLILFILAVLLALCIVVAQVVVQDVRAGTLAPAAKNVAGPPGR